MKDAKIYNHTMPKARIGEYIMNKNSLLFCIILLACCYLMVGVASAQSRYSHVNFDRIFYELGSTGTVTITIESFDVSADIGSIGVSLYFTKTDGTLFETEFIGENYGDSPLVIPADTSTKLSFDFNIPQRSDLKSGVFFYVFELYIREHGTVQYSHDSNGPYTALSDGYQCNLQLPQPTPTPTASPTATPTPTSTPNNQEANVIDWTWVIVALIFAVCFMTLGIFFLKNRK